MTYFDVDRVLSYNCMFNFCLGSRSVGKTYNGLKRGIKNFKKKDEEFMYIRRYETDFEGDKQEIFNGLIKENEFPNDKLEIKSDKGLKGYCNGKKCCYLLPLSKMK